MLKRAYLSVTRRRGKIIILGVILFVIANLVLSSITIGNATTEAMEYARSSLGGEVTLGPDMDKMREDRMAARDSGDMSSMFETPSIYLEDVNSLSSIEYVKDYTYGFSFNANAIDFEVIESESSDNEMFGRMMKEMDMGDLSIESVNAYALLPDVISGEIELIEGNSFEEDNENDVIISYELALENDFSVGDVIEVETVSYDEESISKEFNIIGIYDFTTESESDNRMIDPANTMYTNINSGISLLSEEDYNDGNYVVSNVIFYLDDPANFELFMDEANDLVTDLEDRGLVLDFNSTAYEQMVGPIEGVQNTSSSIMVVVIIAAVLILSLLIINQIKDRKYEIGVLLSLGEKKSKISLQMLIELVIVATAAFLLSMGTSAFIAQEISDNLLSSQLEMSEEQSESYMGRGMGMGPGMNSKQSTSLEVETIDELDVNASINDYMLLFGVGYLIIIGSLIIPTVQILKYEPKTILTGREN